MYEAFYGLKFRPFSLLPDPESFYWFESYQIAYAALSFGIMGHAQIAVLTGEIGAGKTTLIRHLLAEISEDLTVGLISNLKSDCGEVLDWAMLSLDEEIHEEPYVRKFQRFESAVIDRYTQGGRVVLIIDEAQNLSIAQLEELRLLSNINSEKDVLLQLILVGQPGLRDLLKRPELKQLAQRVSSDFHLCQLSEQETFEYITMHLEIAGARQTVFTKGACDLIFKSTGGVPRLINILSDLCLVSGYGVDRPLIEDDLVREFLAEAAQRGIYNQFTPLIRMPRLAVSNKS